VAGSKKRVACADNNIDITITAYHDPDRGTPRRALGGRLTCMRSITVITVIAVLHKAR
jgi:hypothetical protein